MTATIIQFPQRFQTEPCPVKADGSHWVHGEFAPGHGRYCRNADIFCDHDADRRAVCDAELGIRPDGSPLQHGDHVPGGRRYCARKRFRCECGDEGVAMCASVMPRKYKSKKGKKQ